jgi:hypothetical protein
MNEQFNMPVMPPASEPVFQTWMRALTRPNEQTYAAMAASPNAKASTGYLWYFIGSIVQFLLASLVQGAVMRNMMSNYSDQFDIGNPLITILCGAPLAAVVSTVFFAIGAAVVQWIASMFGGRGTNNQMVYVLSTILTPYLIFSGVMTLLSAIPFVGWCLFPLSFLAGIYILVLEIMAVKGVNQVGWGAALAALLIPVLAIVFACACLVGGAFVLLGPALRDVFQQIQQGLPTQ